MSNTWKRVNKDKIPLFMGTDRKSQASPPPLQQAPGVPGSVPGAVTDGDPSTATSLGPQGQPERNPSSALAWDTTKVPSHSQELTRQTKGTGALPWAPSGQVCLPWVQTGFKMQQLRFSSVQNKAFPKSLLWLESACPLLWSFWNTGIFQRKRKRPVLSGIFHGYALPRGDLSLQGNFQHYVIFSFFPFCCLSLQRQADKWRDK